MDDRLCEDRPLWGEERAVLNTVDSSLDRIGDSAGRVGMGCHGKVVVTDCLYNYRELLLRVLGHKRIGTGRYKSSGRHDFDPMCPALAAELDRVSEVFTGICDTAEVPAMAIGAGDRWPSGKNFRSIYHIL